MRLKIEKEIGESIQSTSYDFWISLLHFDIAVDDLASNPMIRLSMGTKIPPPPTPPTLPKAAPKNPIMEPTTIFQPNFILCQNNVTSYKHQAN